MTRGAKTSWWSYRVIVAAFLLWPAAAIAQVPDPPTGVTATDGTSSDHVAVDWVAVAGVFPYKVYRSETLGGAKTLSGADLSVGDRPYLDILAAPETVYYYWVVACNDNGCSDFSAPDTGSRTTALDPPTGVSAGDGTSPAQVSVNWNLVSGALVYSVYRADAPSEAKTLLQANILADDRPYGDASAVPGTTYHYFVKACNAAGCSTFSASDSGYRAAPPDPPTGVTATDGTSSDHVAVRWVAVAGVFPYEVYRSETLGGVKTLLHDALTAGDQPYPDILAVPQTVNYYWMKACNAAGCSDFGAPDTGYRSTALDPPTGVSATDGTSPLQISVNWNLVPGALTYTVYQARAPNEAKTLLQADIPSPMTDRTPMLRSRRVSRIITG